MHRWEDTITVDLQIEAWQQELKAVEAEIGRLRFRQVELIRHLDRFQVDTADGARTMGDWTSAQLDLSRQTASRHCCCQQSSAISASASSCSCDSIHRPVKQAEMYSWSCD